VTEQDWLTCTDPTPMLDFLRGKANDRKLRLFAVGCCRQVWHLIKEAHHRAAVQAAEDFADGSIRLNRLKVARSAAWSTEASTANHVAQAARATVAKSAMAAARQAQGHVIQHVWVTVQKSWETAPDNKQKAQQRQGDLLRDILGNPFRRLAIPLSVRRWNDGTVCKIAQAIYEDRASDRLPILADALEEAGCNEPAILEHCRGPGPHVRGCWVIDLLLGKK
jgi:hypothetical protein